MNHAHPVIAKPLTAVEIDGFIGEPSYLETLPAVRHVDPGRDGGLIIWLEEVEDDRLRLEDDRPERPPEVELHGQGAPRPALLDHPRAQHVEMFFDGLGDPDFAPMGWWHARVWLKAS